MQAELNALTATNKKPVGIVIITRLIEDADGIAEQINELSGRVVAVAHHTKNKADTADVFNSDVLVICHQAFLNAAKGWSVQDRERWHRISQWRGGDRLLFIIDEALAKRAGRFDAHVRMGYPSDEEKQRILDLYLNRFGVNDDVTRRRLHPVETLNRMG
jgi:hypothetical protein